MVLKFSALERKMYFRDTQNLISSIIHFILHLPVFVLQGVLDVVSQAGRSIEFPTERSAGNRL